MCNDLAHYFAPIVSPDRDVIPDYARGFLCIATRFPAEPRDVRRATVKVPPGLARHVSISDVEIETWMSNSQLNGGRNGEIESRQPIKSGGHV